MSSTMITDIHAHILPGLDDGPETVEGAAKLLAAFEEAGTHRVFCTSHFCSPHFEVTFDALSDAYSRLCGELKDTNVEIAPGAEVRLSSRLVEEIRNNRIPTLGDTRYVLVEFRSDHISQRALDLVHELLVRDYQPIMAHPERNLEVQKNPQILEDLLERGILLQLTAQSLVPQKRDAHMAEKLAWRILENGQAAVIASDAHDTTTRPPGLLEAYDNIAARLGQAAVDQLIDNANAIWNNEPCRELQVQAPKRGFFRSLFKF
jgi:protein-tyrosine phosphatase